MSLYVRRDWANAFTLLSTGRVLMAGGTDGERDALRYWLLLDEPGAAQIVKRVSGARDARAALTAVAAGEADGALVFSADYAAMDPKLGAMKELTFLRELPLPVLAINRAVVSAADAQRWGGPLGDVELPVVGAIIRRWDRSAGDKLQPLGLALRRRQSPVGRQLVLADLPPLKLDLASLIPEPPIVEPLLPYLVTPPPRLDPLPELPGTAAGDSSPVVSSRATSQPLLVVQE